MPRYNNEGRSAKFLLDTRSGFQMDRMKGSRKKDMKLKLDTDVRMGDDEDMGSSSQGHHHHNRHQGGKKFQKHPGGRGGKGRGRNNKWNNRSQGSEPRPGGGRPNEFGPGWHKCTIFDGASMNRDNILSIFLGTLGSKNVAFQPICYTLNPPNSMFFVETRAAAEALAAVTLESVKFRVCHSQPPPPAATIPALEEKLSLELKARLSPTGHLNLSSFHSTVSMAVDHYLPLHRNSVGGLVGKIINEWIGCVASVDVSFNKLASTESIAFLSHATNLKCVIANDNKFRDLSSLDQLKSDSIVEINLMRNPVSEGYKSRAKYEQDMKKKFPSLLKLDNQEIDPSQMINFDIDKYAVPNAKRSWFCNESAQNVVKTFATEYIRLYDSNRDDLVHAYSEQAVLTLSSSYMQDKSPSSSLNLPHLAHARLSEYIGESRNIMRSSKSSRKSRFIHVGREEIIRFLKKLPPTKHLQYVIDMPVALEAFIVFTMQGLFEDTREKSTIRHFMRSFTLIPCNNGFVIVNEMLFVTNPTPAQFKSASSAPKPIAQPAASQVASNVPAVTMPVVDAFKPPATMEDKLKLFMEKSLMNAEWARKCLEENAWDLERSMYIFSELSKAGKIPPEAFQPASIS